MRRPRIVLCALEYDAEPFSGNGILAQALVRGLSSIADVFVACARPVDDDDVDDDAVDDDDACVASTTPIVRRARVPRSKWFTLTVDGAHAEFARACGRFREETRAFGADAALGVDFSSRGAAEALGLFDDGVPFAYAPFRIFSRSDARHLELERGACERAKGVLALCASDGRFVAERLRTREDAKISVMHPPLRKRISELASTSTSLSGDGASWERRRGYLTCVVRVSEEKAPDRFVAACEELARRGAFDSGELTPLLCANASLVESSAYARELTARFRACAPSGRVVETFLSPEDLGAIFKETAINVHPPSHDAFGMTVVEAAAFGAPTMLHADGDIGAAEFLRPGVESVGANMEASARDVADRVEEILVDPNTRVIAAAAASRALAWDESSFAESVCNFLMSLAT